MSTLALHSLLLAMKHIDARIESLHDKIEELKDTLSNMTMDININVEGDSDEELSDDSMEEIDGHTEPS
jgi:hypothetical protein